jgi:hypothetical protein
MEHTSIIQTDDTRASELGIVTFQGKEFAAGGFMLDLDRGRMIGYVTKGEPYQHASGTVTSYALTTWEGLFLSRLTRTDRHLPACLSYCRCRGGGPTGFGTPLQSFRTLDPIAGFHWYGRGLGAGMSLKLRRGRKAETRS